MKPKPVTLKMLSAPSFEADDTAFKNLCLSKADALQLDAAMLGVMEMVTKKINVPLEGFDDMRTHIRLRSRYAAEDAVMEQLAKDLNDPISASRRGL